MKNIQKLISDMCAWNRIAAADRTKLAAARDDELSQYTIDGLQEIYINSRKALREIEIEAIKLGLLERRDSYTYITELDMENAQ